MIRRTPSPGHTQPVKFIRILSGIKSLMGGFLQAPDGVSLECSAISKYNVNPYGIDTRLRLVVCRFRRFVMKRILIPFCILFVVAAVPVASVAQDEEELTPDQVELGEIRIKFGNTDYPSIRVDGESWEEAEFTANGKQVSLHRVNRTEQHALTLIPNYAGLEETELTVKPDDWKLVKVNRRDRAWQVEYKIKFKKEKPKPAQKPAEQPAG